VGTHQAAGAYGGALLYGERTKEQAIKVNVRNDRDGGR
jgi:hypothetical protein